jgi:hypothetical protein
MTREELQRFCSTADAGPRIATPWSAGEWSYATDGKLLVRVPRLPDVPERSDAPALDRAVFLFTEDVDWRDIPSLPDPVMDDCRDCGGKGLERNLCETCEGDGKVGCECDECGDTHTRTCRVCGGDGYTSTTGKPCPWCAGVGKREDVQCWEIGSTIFDVRLLRRIANNLPNPKIIPSGRNMAPMKFDGGRGYVMPMIR